MNIYGNGQNVITVKPNIVTKIAKDNTTLPISVSDFLLWNNQTSSVATMQGPMITNLIQTAREIVERYCWLDLTSTTYTSEYDITPWGLTGLYTNNMRLLLPRAPIFGMAAITQIQYLDITGIWNTFSYGSALGIDGLYSNVTMRQEKMNWASIYFTTAPAFDTTRINAYKIQVTFNTGFDFTGNLPLQALPFTLQTAIKNIVAFNYSNRGDVIGGENINGFPVPNGTKFLLDSYSVATSQLGAL